MISHGDFGVFVNRPVSMVFLLATLVFLLIPVFRIIIKSTKKGGIQKVKS
jgi:TctA family transporter